MDSKNLESLQSTFRYEDKELYTAIKCAFEKLYKVDNHLISYAPPNLGNISDDVQKELTQQSGKYHVGERAIVSKFANYLQIEIDRIGKYSDYYIDCEYNRNKTDLKRTPSFPNGAFPDLIIHKRLSNEHNLLIMEFKTYWNNSTKRIDKDLNKVNEFMDEPYNYRYGFVVVIGEELSKLKFIVGNAQKIQNSTDIP